MVKPISHYRFIGKKGRGCWVEMKCNRPRWVLTEDMTTSVLCGKGERMNVSVTMVEHNA